MSKSTSQNKIMCFGHYYIASLLRDAVNQGGVQRRAKLDQFSDEDTDRIVQYIQDVADAHHASAILSEQKLQEGIQ